MTCSTRTGNERRACTLIIKERVKKPDTGLPYKLAKSGRYADGRTPSTRVPGG
jgi:hypothetical protein